MFKSAVKISGFFTALFSCPRILQIFHSLSPINRVN
ncbi:unknown [[Mannheimia] succiniciproducens MBEL55E]|uniref:Uncharacterized protein n=1 Tax=Mannheimia succiniciproducens (strain KCTC 0769BP / MBEL55E) TaxID=221988 RepID=Q65RA2_MANSM|nr:unknown [[Mannheimia] succiniciproducens MBEL55E]